GRLDLRVLHRVPGGLEVCLGGGDGRLGRRKGELRGLVIALGDGLALEQRVAALELRRRVLALRLGHVEVRLGLGQIVARNARVDLGEERAPLDLVPRLDRHLEDLARGLRFHAQRQDRLDRTGWPCRRAKTMKLLPSSPRAPRPPRPPPPPFPPPPSPPPAR